MTAPDHDLQTIDEALYRGQVTAATASDRELQELALALRAEAPEPAAQFAELMDLRVREGFPRERAGRVRGGLGRLASALPRLAGVPRPPLRVLAGVASVLVALAVTVSVMSAGDGGKAALRTDDAGSASQAAPEPMAPSAPDGSAARAADAEAEPGGPVIEESAPSSPISAPPLPPVGGGPGIAPGARNRRIERSATLTLAAPNDELDRVASQVVAIVDRRRGFVLRSSLSTGDEGTTGGSFELRVPARDLQPTLRELSGLATVRGRTQQGEDVTQAFVSVEDRLVSAQAQRRGLLRRLERADTDARARAIRQSLNFTLGEIRGLRGELRSLRERTVYAVLSLTLQADEDASSGASTSATRDALDDALGSMLGAFNLAVRVLGFLLPIALLAGLAAAGGRILRRRRREAALG